MKREIFWLPATIALLSLTLYLVGNTINGPFIFGDESTYFSIARNIAENSRFFPDTQYNPLYPFIISFSFISQNITLAYDIARLINIVAFSLSIIPIYYFARELKFDQVTSLAFGALAVCLPFGAFIHLIWAEPLLYPTVAAGMLFSIRYFKTGTIPNGALAGFFFGLAFLAKQYGLVFATALAFVAFVWTVSSSSLRKQKFMGFLAVMLGSSVCVIPLIIRNAFVRTGNMIGYQSHFDVYLQKYADLGLSDFLLSVAESIFFQLSGIVFGTWGLIVPLVLGVILLGRQLPRDQLMFVFFLLIGLGALVIVSAIHMLGFNLPHLPNGRYYASITPFIAIVGIRWIPLLVSCNRQHPHAAYRLWSISIATAASSLLVWLYSPLKALFALSLVTNPELSFLNRLVNDINGNGWVWALEGLVEPDHRILVAVFPLAMLLAFAFGLKYAPKASALIIAGLMLFQGYDAHRFVVLLASSGHAQNEVMRFALDSVEEQGATFGFDPDAANGNSPFLGQFWLGSTTLPNFDPFVFMNHATISFRNASNTSDPPEIVLSRGERSIVNSNIGLLAIRNFTETSVQFCQNHDTAAINESHQQIFGMQPVTLEGMTEKGLQRMAITVAPVNGCVDQPIEFDVIVQGQTIGTIVSEADLTVSLVKSLNIMPGKFDITLSPKPGNVWTLQSVELTSSSQSSPDLLVSRQILPMPVILKSDKWFIYDRRQTNLAAHQSSR